MFKKSELKSLLEGNITNVSFTKVSGTPRVMRCTLRESNMPAAAYKNYLTGDFSDDNHISVWDLDNNGWRSFRVDSVNAVELM